jgi:hypothetical protein
MKIFEFPVVRYDPAQSPMAVLEYQFARLWSAANPRAVLSSPELRVKREYTP